MAQLYPIAKGNTRGISVFLFLLIISVHAYGQGGRSGGNSPGERPKIGKLTGKVIDAANNEPVEYATISLLSRRDSSLITGTVTNEKGEFDLQEIPVGAYRVRISFLGYRNAIKDSLFFSQNVPERNVGTIKLNPIAQALDEVVVSAEKEVFQQSIDKRIFNVEQNIVTQGGAATDVLATVPSVSVDADGNVALRGSGGVIVLIDGKPSGLTGADRSAILEQIPASAIESIEIITNPSSRYDAEGMAGIINIILKKNKLQGMNGQASVSAGTRDKYNAALNLNYRAGKFNIFSNYSYRYNTNFFRGYTDRQFIVNDTSRYLFQNNDALNTMNVHMIRAGVDYNLTPKTTLGIVGLYNTRKATRDRVLESNSYDANRALTDLFYRNNQEKEDGDNLDLTFNFRQTFVRPGQELTASANYSTNSEVENTVFTQQQYNLDRTPSDEIPMLQNTVEDVHNTLITLQADYVHPVQKDGKLEAGYKSIIREIDNDFVFENFNYGNNTYEVNPWLSNHFVFNEQVHSLYSNFTNKLGTNFSYQLGARLEQTLTNSIQKTTGQTFENNYLNFFPSVFLSYKLKNEQQWQINYSRRVNRPGIRNLNPFVDMMDPLNIQFGNPRLNPELTNAFELSYLKGWKNIFLTSSVYYRQTNGVIQRIIRVNQGEVLVPEYLNPDSLSSFLITFENLNSRTEYGFEFIARTSITKWWNVTSNFNFFRSAVNGTNLETNFNNANLSWSLMLMSSMNIPKIAQVQLTGNYRGPMATAQGIMQPMYGINIGVKRDVLKNNGSISLNVSDVFDTRQFGMVTTGPGFDQRILRKRESQIATLTFTYRFGKIAERGTRNERRRGNVEGGEQNGGGDEDFF